MPESDTRLVRGIRVHKDIADDLELILAAAESDQIVFTGHGYRSNDRQIEIRKSNCGTSLYAIYEMPSSECRTPTARPGVDTHQKGMQLTFWLTGRSLKRMEMATFGWLRTQESSDLSLNSLRSRGTGCITDIAC